ncbi:MAG TPA: MFS transporter [Gemmatimonadaceae bacterium]
MVTSLGARNPFRVLLTHRNFRRFWVGQTLSLIGTWMQTMAMGWLALELSDSAFVVGLVAAARSFPIVVLSLPAGVLVDRSDRLRLVKIAQSLLLLEASVLWFLTLRGAITVGWMLALALVAGTVSSIEIPARQSLMIDLVGRDDLRDAIALNSSGFNLARIVGPALGAAIIAQFGIAWCFGVNALSYLTVLIGLARVQLPPWHLTRMPKAPFHELREGLAFILGHRTLRTVLELIAVFTVLGVPYIALMPVLARERLGLGAEGYGLLLSALGIGGLTGALTLAAAGHRARHGRTLLMTSSGFAALLLGLSLLRSPGAAVVVLLGTGMLMIVSTALGNTILQRLVPDEFRGRLMSIYSLIVVGLPQVLGAFAAGAIARAVGVAWAIGGAAVLMLLYMVVASRRLRVLRDL